MSFKFRFFSRKCPLRSKPSPLVVIRWFKICFYIKDWLIKNRIIEEAKYHWNCVYSHNSIQRYEIQESVFCWKFSSPVLTTVLAVWSSNQPSHSSPNSSINITLTILMLGESLNFLKRLDWAITLRLRPYLVTNRKGITQKFNFWWARMLNQTIKG